MSVDKYCVTFYGEALTGETDGTFDEVLPAVYGAVYDIAEACFVLVDFFVAILAHKEVVVHGCVFEVRGHGVAGREVEHYDIAFFDIPQTFETAVFNGRFVEV